MNETKMFCFQCQETAKGTGCTTRGVCGKLPETSLYMDILLSIVKTMGTLMEKRMKTMPTDSCDKDKKCCPCFEEVSHFITDSLFATITNANFDDESIKARIRHGLKLLEKMRGYDNEDVKSLKELTMFGLKGMAAYYEHAARLGKIDERIIAFMAHALAMISKPNVSVDELFDLVLETGKTGVDVMALLDKANTEAYGNPEITKVNIGVGKNPGILISGHDLRDIEDLLRQTEGIGIDVYTHSEMLPAHYYPKLKAYKHLVGNYGNAWWRQKEEFESFHGPIIFTTNCIVPPLANASYQGRVFTLNSTGYPGWKHIPTGEDGHKDFSEVIAMAKTCEPPTAIDEGEIVGGFAHAQVFALADKIVEAVKSGAIKKFVVMSGCDGRMKSREYYEQFAKSLPKDTIILTSGCAKYRYIKLPLGEINGIPRVLDAGQCNDSYSWVIVAMKLQEIFRANSINDLPIVFNIAWYEQKAVIVLLALLSLGIKNIHIGPTLPAFVSPNVLKVLVEKFGLGSISTVEEDLKSMQLTE